MFIAENWLNTALDRVFEACVGFDRCSESDLLATLLFSTDALLILSCFCFSLEPLLFLLERDLNFRFLLWSLM